MSSTERPPGELPGVFARQDRVKPYLTQFIAQGAPQCFLGTFQLMEGEGFFVAHGGERYRVLSQSQERHTLTRHLRTATPGMTETDGGGYRLHQGFAVIRAIAPSGGWCWLLIDAMTAAAAIRAIEDAPRACTAPT